MAAVTLLKGHVSRALDFYNKNDLYIGIGKTTEWGDKNDQGNEIAPIPVNTDELLEVAGYKKVESKFLVRPAKDDEVNLAEIVYQGKKWKIISYNDALSEGARWVYISTYLSYSDFPIDLVYRQISTFSGLKPKDGVESGKFVLFPEEVESPGIPEMLDNRTPVYREADQREKLSVIIEF